MSRTLEELIALLWWLLAVPWLGHSMLDRTLEVRTGDQWAHVIVLVTIGVAGYVLRWARRWG